MNSQTVRRPENQRPKRPNKSKKYSKQTARFEGRRDGKPLVFGWGGHLSHNQKVQLQRRATWAGAIVVALLIVVVIVGYWININVITPGLPITSVNGHQIPQSQYRKLVAFKAQLEQNKIYGPHGLITQRDDLRKQVATQQNSIDTMQKQITSLNTQIKALPAGPSDQRTQLTDQLTAAQKQLSTAQAHFATLNQQFTNLNKTLIPQEQTSYTQSQIGNDSATWLQDDELIREWLAKQSSSVQTKVNPSASTITHALNDFKANIPKTSSYSNFLSKDGVSDDDIQAMVALNLRRENTQTYLASLEVSPAYQVLARTMTIDTQANAQKILTQLQKGGDFGKIAKASSVDTNTNKQGGSLGWMARGQYAQAYGAAVVENWMFDPSRKLNELSPVLSENGSFHIVQILKIDPSRTVDKTTLQTLQNNALANWLLEQRALPSTKITPADQNKLLDPLNLPPDLPAAAPSSGQGAPGGAPGGSIPGQP